MSNFCLKLPRPCWKTTGYLISLEGGFAHVEIRHPLRVVREKAMAPHSSTLAWKIPWTEKPGGLQSMGSLRFGHD